jgi:hypothetical protein
VSDESTSVNSEARDQFISFHSLISPSGNRFQPLSCRAMHHTARSDRSAAVLWLQSRRNNDGREPTSPVLSSHARTQSTAHFLCPSLAFPFAPSLMTLREIWEHRPRIMAGWLERLISVMKAIIIDIALDLSLLSRRFQGVKPSETYFIQLLVTWECRSPVHRYSSMQLSSGFSG